MAGNSRSRRRSIVLDGGDVFHIIDTKTGGFRTDLDSAELPHPCQSPHRPEAGIQDSCGFHRRYEPQTLSILRRSLRNSRLLAYLQNYAPLLFGQGLICFQDRLYRLEYFFLHGCPGVVFLFREQDGVQNDFTISSSHPQPRYNLPLYAEIT